LGREPECALRRYPKNSQNDLVTEIMDEEEKIYGRGPIWHVIKEVKGQGLRILDVGCGTGATGEELQKRGHVVYGVDISEQAIAEARIPLTRAEDD